MFFSPNFGHFSMSFLCCVVQHKLPLNQHSKHEWSMSLKIKQTKKTPDIGILSILQRKWTCVVIPASSPCPFPALCGSRGCQGISVIGVSHIFTPTPPPKKVNISLNSHLILPHEKCSDVCPTNSPSPFSAVWGSINYSRGGYVATHDQKKKDS